jgi:NADH:ubiquinone oxidoreductase subunit 3 (subunit A)
MTSALLIPPIAFSLVMLIVMAQSFFMKRLSLKAALGAGATKPYSCGEDMEENRFRPEYGQFFSFAFFFSIMHVVALVVATMPSGLAGSYFIAALYIIGALIGLIALLRRDDEDRR